MKKLLGVLIASLFLTTSVLAAPNQGTVGSTSTGDLQVTLEKGDLVQITNLADIDFPRTPTVPSSQFIDICVYASSSGNYTIAGTSSHGDSGNFRLANAGNSVFINYTVEYNDQASGSLGDGTALVEGGAAIAQTGADAAQTNCGGGNNARVFIDIDATTFGSATADNYDDTLTLVVAPN
jgi:spore coat protein U-like protein